MGCGYEKELLKCDRSTRKIALKSPRKSRIEPSMLRREEEKHKFVKCYDLHLRLLLQFLLFSFYCWFDVQVN